MSEWAQATLKVWQKVKSSFCLPKAISVLSNIGYLKGFVPSYTDTGFKKWSAGGFTSLYNLYKDGCIKSFDQLKEEFKIQNTDFFRYLQLREFLTKHEEWYTFLHPTLIEEFLIKLETKNVTNKVIGPMYQIFLEMSQTNTKVKEKLNMKLIRTYLRTCGKKYALRHIYLQTQIHGESISGR